MTNIVVVGPLIVDERELPGGEQRAVPGGVVYAAAGARSLAAHTRLVSNAGPDFDEFYGAWMARHDIDLRALGRDLPATKRTRLRYVDDGLFVEEPWHGPELHERLLTEDRRSAEQILSAVDDETIGVYIEAAEDDPIWDDRGFLEALGGTPLLWEVQTDSALDPDRRSRTLEVIRRVDIFSVNLPEARALFDVDSEEDAVQAILDVGVPCFFRVGARGSHWIDGRAWFSASVRAPEVDPTGCGNASTAAALAAFAQGRSGFEISSAANAAAARVLQQYGPPDLVG